MAKKFSGFTDGLTSQSPTDTLVGLDLSQPANAQNTYWALNSLFSVITRNITDGALRFQGFAAPAVSAAGQGSLYFDSSSNTFKISQNGGAYADIHTGTITVPQGGTGLSSLTAYAILAGGTSTTGNVQQVSGLGSAGQVLTSNGAGTLPSWQAAAAGNPAGVGTELQYRNGAAFGAIASSSVSGSSVGIGGAVDSKAILTLTSTTLGFLVPRMTTTERDAIASPTLGLQLFNATTGALNARSSSTAGGTWQALLSDYYYAFNPLVANNDANFRPAIYWNLGSDGSTLNPNFSTATGLTISYSATSGQNDVDQAAKTTFSALSTSLLAKGQGQRIGLSNSLTCYGMGDAISEDRTLQMWGGVSAAGDEGTKWLRWVVSQGNYAGSQGIVSVTTPATINTTTSGAITKSINAQAVAVVDATGVVANQWIQVDVGEPSSLAYSRAEAVKVISVSGNNITAIFRHNHPSGAIVKPSVVLVLDGAYQFGQGRYLVNLTATPYTTGTAASAGSVTFTGVGTSWANSMVGGDANNPGVIQFSADTYTSAPFSPGDPLYAWYPIASVVSGTSLNIYRRDQVGLAAYRGNQTAQAAYTIRPGARIMMFDPPTDGSTTVVLEANTFTWTAADRVQCAISSSGDVSGGTLDLAWYMPGATLRDGLNIRNSGPQVFQTGLTITRYGGGSRAFSTGIDLSNVKTGIVVDAEDGESNIYLRCNSFTKIAGISWDGAAWIRNTTAGLEIAPSGGLSPIGTLDFRFLSGDAAKPQMHYTGSYRLTSTTPNETYIDFEGLSSNTWRIGTATTNQFQVTRTASGSVISFPDRTGIIALTDVQQKAGDPTTSDIAAGTWAVYKNTSSGAVKLWCNDGGVMKSVALT